MPPHSAEWIYKRTLNPDRSIITKKACFDTNIRSNNLEAYGVQGKGKWGERTMGWSIMGSLLQSDRSRQLLSAYYFGKPCTVGGRNLK
jgi:hypothetical protein